MTQIALIVFVVSTAFFMKRGGYEWIPSILTGIVSPIAYLILYATILLPAQLVIGKVGISEEILSNSTIEFSIAVMILIAWVVFGFFLSRKNTTDEGSSQGLNLQAKTSNK